MPYDADRSQQPSPETTVWSCAQFATMPGCVGAGGGLDSVDDGMADEETVEDGRELVELGATEEDTGLSSVPIHTARRALPVRPSKRPSSQLLPTQGFHASSWATVILAVSARPSQVAWPSSQAKTTVKQVHDVVVPDWGAG